jgi:tetratricopeptide (TPR) repeat protein
VKTPEKWALGATLAAAFILRVLLVVSLREAPYFRDPIVDGAAYDRWAHEIATASFWGERAFYQDPLYPYALGLFYKVFGRDLLWARIAQALLGTLGLWMLFEGTRRLADVRTAFTALALGAVTKTMLFFDTAILKDFLGVVAVEACILLVSLDRKWKWLAFGAALGLGALVRGNMLLLAAAAAVFLALRRDWKPAGAVLLGALACILPITVRNAVMARDFVLTTAQLGPNLYTGNNPENATGRYRPPSFLQAGSTEFEEKGFREEARRRTGREMKASEVDAYWRNEALGHIASNPGTFLAVTGKRLLMLLNGFEVPDDYDPYFMARFSWVLRLPLFTFGLFTLPLAAAGIYLSWTDRARFGMLYVLLGAYLFSILFFFVFSRYRLPVVPLLLVFGAYAVTRGSQLLRWRMSAVPKTAAAVFAAALLLANVPLPAAVGGHRDFRTAHYNLGLHYARSERPKEAAEEFEAAARLNPEYFRLAPFVWALGEACEKAGRADDAFEYYARAADLDRESPEAAYKVGMIYFGRGAWDRAALRLGDAAARDPSYAPAYGPLAEAQLKLGNAEGALASLRAGAVAAPRDWTMQLRRAELAKSVSKWKEALEAAEAVLALRPDEAAARAIRDEARRRQ